MYGCGVRSAGGTVGGQQRSEEESQKTPKSFEEPSKNFRNITLTSRLHSASNRLSGGWQCRGWRGLGGSLVWWGTPGRRKRTPGSRPDRSVGHSTALQARPWQPIRITSNSFPELPYSKPLNMKKLLVLLMLSSLGVLAASPAPNAPVVLLEAEQFADLGGWVVDQQFMDQMGSPYLLAHGLGEPVRDAETTVQFPAAGKYRVWVRTRDWVAPWKAPGAPGRFKLLVNGKPLSMT